MGSKAKFSQRIDVPGTADTPENLQGGVLLVFPPGFGPTLSPGLDASAQALERQKLSRPRGRITARQVDRGPEVPQLLKWLERAGFPVAKKSKSVGRSFLSLFPLNSLMPPISPKS